MKKNFLLPLAAMLLMGFATLQAQNLVSIGTQPANPTTTNPITVVMETWFNSGDCTLDYYTTSINGNTIVITAYYTRSILQYICYRTDMFNIGNSFSCGIYTVYVNAFTNGSLTPNMSASTSFQVNCGAASSPIAVSVEARTAELAWVTSCANGYVVQFRETGSSKWRSKKVHGNNGNATLHGLRPSSDYEWQVASVCGSGNQSALSDFTPLQYFSTPAARMMSSTDLWDQETENGLTFSISPNPAFNYFNIAFHQDVNGAIIEIYNLVGERIYTSQIEGITAGTNHQIITDKLGAGIYFVKVSDSQTQYIAKLIVQ